ASFREGIFSWTPPFDFVENKSAGIVARILRELPSFNRWFSQDEASLWIEFIASDADFNVIHPVKITVKDVNRKPQFQSLTPARIINTQINEPVLFQVEVADLDQDALSYRWIFGVGEPRIKGTKAVERVFVTPGTKKVSVIVSDGLDSVRTTWTVNVLPEEAGKDVSLGPPVFDVYVVEG
ncbi:MAG TPA: PKD domain-containing protein, partial [Candidatus Nanoarchaeia archaeon]|nr:PKD domain-containing protein [Candidatus Nanoarchaeia archaeon]